MTLFATSLEKFFLGSRNTVSKYNRPIQVLVVLLAVMSLPLLPGIKRLIARLGFRAKCISQLDFY